MTAPEIMAQRSNNAINLIKEAYSNTDPGVSYLIAYQGETLASGAVGVSNLEWGTPLTSDAVLRLGSISKPLTAIAILQLVEQGKLDLDVPLSTYSQSLPNHMGQVSLRQILSHRSGIAEHAFDESLLPYIWQPMAIEKIIELQEGKQSEFEPGEQYTYVNFNYVLVAHIIEQVIQETFVSYANDSIFKSNGMDSSHYDELEIIIPNRANFYNIQEDGSFKNTAAVDLSHVSAAGALLSTVKDMAHWIDLLSSGKLISKELLQEAWRPALLPDDTPTSYGLGFNVTEMAGERIIWHTGLTPGAQAAFNYAPDAGLFVILLSNYFSMSGITGKLVDQITTIMLTGKMDE